MYICGSMVPFSTHALLPTTHRHLPQDLDNLKMKLPGGSWPAIAAGIMAASLFTPDIHLYVTPLTAAVAGFAILPAGGLLQKGMLATMGTLSAGALGYHQFHRTHPACPLLPPGEQELALVTGASSGIGREISKELAKKGFGLVLVSRREDKLRELAEEIHASRPAGKNDAPVHVFAADLSLPAEATRLYERVSKHLRVTMLVNNAGLGYTEAFCRMPLDKVEELIHLNTLALTKLTRLFGADMVARGRGRLMSVSSIAGAAPGPLVAVYAASKAFVSSFTLAIQHELEPHGVTVTNLVPGATFTEFQSRAKAHSAVAFTVPGLAMSADKVARAGVEGMLRGDSVVVPGFVNRCYILATSILPPKLLRVVTSLAWSELPI